MAEAAERAAVVVSTAQPSGGFRGSSGGFRGSSAGFRGGGFRGVGGYRGFRGYYGGGYYPGYYGYYNPFLWDTGWDYGDSGYGYPADQYADQYNDYGGYGSYGAPNPSPQVMIISNQAPPPVYVQAPPAPAVWKPVPRRRPRSMKIRFSCSR